MVWRSGYLALRVLLVELESGKSEFPLRPVGCLDGIQLFGGANFAIVTDKWLQLNFFGLHMFHDSISQRVDLLRRFIIGKRAYVIVKSTWRFEGFM